MSDVLSPRQRQAAVARQAFQARFTSPEEKSAYYRDLAHKANAGRVVVPVDELARLVDIVGKIAVRLEARTEPAPSPTAE